ncbi:MAG: epoxyqueuosine reductase [Desulfobacteraceae bacterium]|nr:MAG: epoxyqueuosine reductase [Desulfobacteraceae bacterium]
MESESERLKNGGWWQKPLVATAPVDERFEQLPRIAADNHIQPRDLLQTARSVIVFFIPFTEMLVKENRKGVRPCRNWGLAYVATNGLIERLSRALGELLETNGFKSGLTPATHNFDDIKLMARWSHKHLAHLVGLGRFGIHHMMITPAGCAGRLGSLVTEADLGEHPLIQTDEACLLKAGKECGKCIEACPVEALSETGFDRRRCWDRLNENRNVLDSFSDLPESTHVCGKCAALLPCSFKNPVAGM